MKTFKQLVEAHLAESDTHKWYSVKGWKDGSAHHDTLDNLVGDEYRHAATATPGHPDEKRPDHHIGIPRTNLKAIAFMDRVAKKVD